MVTIAADARWANGTCHIPYKVTVREFAPLGATLQEYTYPTDTIHTEHWKVPSAGVYRMEITIGNQTTCLPFSGYASITSP